MKKSVSIETKTEFKYLLQLLSSGVNCSKASFKEDTNWRLLLNIAFSHSVSNVLYYSINTFTNKQKALIPPDVLKELKDSFNRSLIIDANQHYETDILIKTFEKYAVDNLPIKGYYFKDNYPKEHMRTMVDVDILFNKEQIDLVKKSLDECNFVADLTHDNHHNYYKQPFVYLEMHSSLTNKNNKNYNYFLKAFERSNLCKGYNHSYKMNKEDEYIFFISHGAKHFEHGGIGIKFFLDLYVFIKKNSDIINKDYIDKELNKIGLLLFEQKVAKMASSWFENGGIEDIDTVTEYVILSGTMGRSSVSILKSAVNDSQEHKIKNKQIAKFIFIFRGVFPGYKKLKSLYPILEKYKILYPFSWFYWLFNRIFIRKNIYVKNLKYKLNYTNQDDVKYYNNIMNQIGLK